MAFGLGLIVGLVVWFVVVPRQRKAILKKLSMSHNIHTYCIILHFINQIMNNTENLSPHLIRKEAPKETQSNGEKESSTDLKNVSFALIS